MKNENINTTKKPRSIHEVALDICNKITLLHAEPSEKYIDNVIIKDEITCDIRQLKSQLEAIELQVALNDIKGAYRTSNPN